MDSANLFCRGCERKYDLFEGLINSCGNKDDKDNINHILEKNIMIDSFDLSLNTLQKRTAGSENPFLIFKELFYSYHLAQKLDVDYEAIVESINLKLKEVGGIDFRITPIIHGDASLGKVFIKDETGNVSGSHKARHIMGNILYLEVLRLAEIIKERPQLAIYSCGNAALAAATVAKAAGYKIDVFVPPDINPKVDQQLLAYQANVVKCIRKDGESGDPCYNRFQEALKEGAVACSCAGTDNWSNIEGGQTLFLEALSQFTSVGIDQSDKLPIDSVVIQVGGGALASSGVKTAQEIVELGYSKRLPKIYTVQTQGAFPLARAYALIIKEIAGHNDLKCSLEFTKCDDLECCQKANQSIGKYLSEKKSELENIIVFIKDNFNSDKVLNTLKQARRNRSHYMWAWESTPQSIAHGILDDITYDWFKIIEGMLQTGGMPVVVSEKVLKSTNVAAIEATGIQVDHTGTSGLAGALELLRLGHIDKTEKILVLFTGKIR